jgi:hypothetical protein
MNERREARIPGNRIQSSQSVAIILFGEPDIQISARIKNLSGRGVGLELEGPVAPGTPLKIELEDALLLGEVIYCRQDDASYYVGVELEHSLCGLGELSRIVLAFNDAMAPADSGQRAHAVVEGDHKSQQQSD